MLKRVTLEFNSIISNSKQGFVLIMSLNVAGCLRSKQQQLASQQVLQHKAQPRKPTGVDMAGRSVEGTSGCLLTCRLQE
jgi:hypothetical protein